MRVGRAARCLLLLAVGTTSGLACRPTSTTSAAPQGQLRDFEGSIDNKGQTSDPVKSDLAVRAAKALESGDAATAEGLYRQRVEAYPTDPSSYEFLGACLFFQKRYDEARIAYRRALELDSRSADARYGLGCIDYKEGKYHEAEANLIQALEVRENDGRNHRVLALVYVQLKERSKARTHFERAAALSPAIASEQYVRDQLAKPAP